MLTYRGVTGTNVQTAGDKVTPRQAILENYS